MALLIHKAYVSGHTRRDGRTQKRVWVRPYYNRRSRHDYLPAALSNDTSIAITKESLSNIKRNPLLSRVVGEERRLDKLIKMIPTGYANPNLKYYADLRVFENLTQEETAFHDFTDHPAECVYLLDTVARNPAKHGKAAFVGKRQLTFSIVENEEGEKEVEIGLKMNYLSPELDPKDNALAAQSELFRQIEAIADSLKRPVRLRVTVPKRAAAVYAYAGFDFSSHEERQRFTHQATRAVEALGEYHLGRIFHHLARRKAAPRAYFEAIEGNPAAWDAVNHVPWHASAHIAPRPPKRKPQNLMREE